MKKLSTYLLEHKFGYLLGFLSMVIAVSLDMVSPQLTRHIIDDVIVGGDLSRLKYLLGGILLVGAGRCVFGYTKEFTFDRIGSFIATDMRKDLFAHIQSLSADYFDRTNTGELMSRVKDDIDRIWNAVSYVSMLILEVIFHTAIVLFCMYSLNWKLALITCCPIPLILFSGVIFAKKVRPFFKASQKCMGELNAKLQDNLSGLHEIQSFGQEEFEDEQVKKKNFEQVRAMLRALRASAVFHPSVEFLSSVGTVLVVFFGGVLAYRGQLSVEDIVAFMLYLSLFYAPVSGLANLLENLQQSLAGAERVTLILDTPSAIQDAPEAEDLGKAQGSITFEDVSFHYANKIPVLKKVSFSCEPGMMVALVGPTGVGKTTMTQLLSRFYDPVGGRILIDGKDIKNVTLQSLRRNISPVLQDTFLFNGTIADNIGYAKPDATREEIEEAAKAANIHEDIMHMPDRYETKVGERGLRLSGGQKQRVAIARAILRQSPIIILDEATASVDVETERQIQKAINCITGKRTIIAIAHRLSTIRNADLILVIQEGEIIERGTHDQLMAQKGTYYRMQNTQ